MANLEQVMSDYFADYGKVAPPDTTVVSWVPLSHNMGLFIGVCAPILAGLYSVLMSPMAFIQRPARWMQLLARHSRTFSPAPNFAFELAARTTTDEDMAGVDLGDVFSIICGGERVSAATIRRFTERFARFNLTDSAIRPSYGLAEATVYVATRRPGAPPRIVCFEPEKLCDATAEMCSDGTALVSYGAPHSPTVRIVDPDSRSECVAGTVGEIWVHGDNVASGYWEKPEETERSFGARLAAPSAGAPEEPWLMSRPLEDCEGCPVLAGVRNLGRDESQRRCSDLHCNFGVRSSRAASSGCSAQSRVRSSGGCTGRTVRRAEWQALAECVARGGEHAPDTPKSKRALRFSSLADPMPRSVPALPGRQAVPP